MQWNFGEIIDYISDVISPGVPLSTAHTAMVKNLINVSIGDVAIDFPINDLKVPDQFVRTVEDYSTGTLTATDESKTLTGDSTVWTYKMIGRKIRIDDGEAYYTVANVVSATEITLDRPFNGSGAGLEYNLFENSYDIPTIIGATGWVKSIIDPSQTGNPAEEENWDWIESQDPTLQHTGWIECFALIGNKNVREPFGTTNLTADATTSTTTVVDSSLKSDEDDYYKNWVVVNVTREKTSIVSSYTESTKTLTLEEEIVGQVVGDTFYLLRNAPQITFYRRPNTVRDILIKGYKGIPQLFNLYDVPIISEDFLNFITANVLMFYYNKNEEKMAIWQAVANKEGTKLRGKYNRKVSSRQKKGSFQKRYRMLSIAIQD